MHLTNVVLSQLCPEIRNASGSSSPVAPYWTAQYSTFTATPTFIGSPSSCVVVSVSPGLCVSDHNAIKLWRSHFTPPTSSLYPPLPWTDEPFSKAPLPVRL